MGEEKRNPREHWIQMTDRERMQIFGVTDVLSFDEENVTVDTTCGMLSLKGVGLHVGRLNLEDGEVAIEGHIDAVTYADSMDSGKHPLLARLFR